MFEACVYASCRECLWLARVLHHPPETIHLKIIERAVNQGHWLEQFYSVLNVGCGSLSPRSWLKILGSICWK